MSPGLRAFLALSVALHFAGAYALTRVGTRRGVDAAPRLDSLASTQPPAGETFDIGEALGRAPSSVEPSTAGEPASVGARSTPGAARPAHAGDHAGHARGTESPLPVLGAAGDRAAVDLATSFTRGFPQAASSDALWLTAPLGSAGEADVSLDLDEAGGLSSVRIAGHPSPALRAGIDRTIALIRARAFTSTARVTRLHVEATIASDEVHDGLHGEVFAIGGSFAEGEGSAFFALAVGRRIDVRVRADSSLAPR